MVGQRVERGILLPKEGEAKNGKTQENFSGLESEWLIRNERLCF